MVTGISYLVAAFTLASASCYSNLLGNDRIIDMEFCTGSGKNGTSIHKDIL